jgi:opacity protein-like surface antigen
VSAVARVLVTSRSMRAALIAVALLTAPTVATAQTRARVTSDGVTVWRPGFAIVATVANTGDVFEVMAQRGDWYEVVVPAPEGQPDTVGLIAVSRVELIGAPPPTSGPTAPGASQARQPPPRAPLPANRSLFRLAVQGGYGRFTADQAFEAVTGSPGGPWFGGGVRYDAAQHYFVEGSVEYYQATGERVFVLDDTVYKLGIENTTRILPLMFTGGLSMRSGGTTAYVGGGAGAYFLRESAEFTEDSEDVKETSLGYRAVAGVVFPLGSAVSGGVEFQYNTVPDGLEGGAAAAFDESNLGGINILVKFLFGR